MASPVLLCYHLTGEKASKIRFSAMRCGIRVREVAPEEYTQTLAALCGLEPAAAQPYAGQPFEDEMLVMAHFTDGLIQQFLQTQRRMKAAPVALKAVLTDTNQVWDSLKLHGELSAERAAIQSAGKPLHQPGKG